MKDMPNKSTSSFDMPNLAAEELENNYISTQAAAERLGVTTWTVESKCRAYRTRLEGIRQDQKREPSPAERRPQLPKEMECLWFGQGKGPMLYLVRKSGLDNYPVHRPDPVTGKLARGRPAGSGRGSKLQRRIPREQDRRFKENRGLPARTA